MGEREGRGVLLYLLLDVATDEEARAVADKLGAAMGEVDGRFVGYAVSDVEPISLTFEEEASGPDTGAPPGDMRREQ